MADSLPKIESPPRPIVYSNTVNYGLLNSTRSPTDFPISLSNTSAQAASRSHNSTQRTFEKPLNASVGPNHLSVNGNGEHHRLAASRSEVRAVAAASVATDRAELKVKITNMSKKTVAGTIRNAFLQYGELEAVDIVLDDNDLPSGSAILLYRPRPQNLAFLKQPLTLDGRSIKLEITHQDNYNRRDWRDGRLRSQKAKFDAQKLEMGVMSTPSTFISEWSTDQDVGFAFNFKHRNLQLFFSYNREKYRLESRFKDIEGDIRMVQINKSYYMTIHLKNPPRYWKQNPKGQRMTKYNWSMSDQWERITTIPIVVSVPGTTSKRREPLMPVAPPNSVNLGQCVVYHLHITPAHRSIDQFKHLMEEAVSYNLFPRPSSMQFNIPLTIRPSSELEKPIDHIGRATLPFDVLYMLECAICSRVLNEYNLNEQFYEMLHQLDPDVSCRILETFISSRKRVWNPIREFQDTWDKMGRQLLKPRKIPPQYALIRKFLVTPSTMYPQVPNMETTNRVVRHFSQYVERFARVQFLDDSLSRIGASPRGFSNEALYNRIFDVLQNGIQIGPRRYEFLAFSSSQLREHGCWFFAPTKDLRANHVRAWMGNFSNVRIVAKYSARMGQCFSSTQAIIQLSESEVKTIPDVVRNGYTFSDGVGKISPKLAGEIANLLGMMSVPSAFQFRLGGAKGVLTLTKDDVDEREIQLRPSQIKFDTQHSILEVIRPSNYIPSYLNRQAITILSSLGVPDSVFLDMVNAMLSSMNRMISNATEAIRVLQANVDEYGTAKSMSHILSAGFLERKDPYILNLLNLFRMSQLKDLKKKAKIIVPQGAYLLGVMDETNSLKENEVFVQISAGTNDSKSHRQIIKSDCILFRNPCFHPGDIRVVQAVDYPALHHLVNVIVFPAQGYRDLASMCSGGDLDGDDYSIFWDPRLQPTIKNYPAMDYKADEPLTVDSVTISHVQKFFVNYINNDNLGQIANAHLATADRSQRGAMDGACLRLAQLHSLAVDFPKSGKPAKLEDELRVRVFPDFMEKKDKESYESQKVLGKIYRLIDKKDYKKYKDVLTTEASYDQRLYVEGMQKYIAEARELKVNYDRDILSLMNQYGVLSEAEIVSGYIIKWLRKDNKRRSHEVHKQTMNAVINLRKVYRNEFYREFFDETKKEISRDRLPDVEAKAAAWYYVTYHEDEAARIVQKAPDQQRFFSFCWIVDTHLCNIAKNNGQQQTRPLQAMDPVSIEAYRKALNEEHIDLLTKAKIENLKLSHAILNDEEGKDELDDESDSGPVLSIKLKELVEQPVSQGQTSSFDNILGYPMEDEKRTVARADDGIDGLKKALGFM